MDQKVIAVLWIFFFSTILFVDECDAGQEIFQKGVASITSEKKSINIARLRQQAIENAMDLAVLQVNGAQVSSERGGSTRANERIIIHNDRQTNTTSEQNRFITAAKTRVEGHARLVKITREWLDGQLYYVEAIFDVDTPDELLAKKNAGYYWNRVGRPSIGLNFQQEINGLIKDERDCNTLQFLRENLSKNDLITNDAYKNSQYLIKANKQITYHLSEMGTFTVNCRLSFQLIDQTKDETIAEYRKTNGPKAGFSVEQATDDCLKTIAPDVSEHLIRTIAKTMNDHWNNGIELKIIIDNVSGSFVSEISEIINNIFQVTSTLPSKYSNGTYLQMVNYKGSGGELSQAIQDAFGDENWIVDIRHIDEHTLRFDWISTK